MIMFGLGTIVATPGAVDLAERGLNLTAYLNRHANGDWGDVDAHDKAANDAAIYDGTRILSSYKTEFGKLWIITEADRSATTFLLPDEY